MKNHLHDIPEPDALRMSLNGTNEVRIKFLNPDTGTIKSHNVFFLGYVDESHSSFRFVYTNSWRKDPKKTEGNARIACKYSGDPVKNTSFENWIPPCWIIKGNKIDKIIPIIYISTLADYGERFKKKCKRILYKKARQVSGDDQMELDLK